MDKDKVQDRQNPFNPRRHLTGTLRSIEEIILVKHINDGIRP